MPTYGYKCDQCGHELEAIQRMSDPALRTCPSCGAEALRRQIFAAGVLFKGSGFYSTDYRRGSKGESAGSDGSSGSSGSSGSDASSGSSNGSSEKKSEAPKSESGSSDKASTSTD